MLVTNHKTELTSARLFIGQFEMRVLWHVTSFMVANSWNPTDYRITSERAGDILHTSSTIKLVPCYMPHDHFEGRLGLKRMRGSRGARKIAKIDISANHDSSPTTPGDSRGRRGWGSRGIGLNETTQIRYEQERLQGKELFSGTRLKKSKYSSLLLETTYGALRAPPRLTSTIQPGAPYTLESTLVSFQSKY